MWAPKLHQQYCEVREELLKHHPDLKWLWRHSPFAAATWNLGPQTATFTHRDKRNSAGGWCAITALGDFNPDEGGHLVLDDLGLVIRFPPGSTVLIPSAVLAHSNVPVPAGQRRYSLTQYTAGGLMRWCEYGRQKLTEWEEKATPAQLSEKKRKDGLRWQECLARFSTLHDLRTLYRQM